MDWNRQQIIDESIEVINTIGMKITVRQLYYQLVSKGLPNTQLHYKRVVSAMTKARWNYDVDFDVFIDRDREMWQRTQSEQKDVKDEIEEVKMLIDFWMKNYSLERWSNQPYYVEVWIEKKALQGVFEKPCEQMAVGLGACKGYPSLTFLNEAMTRFDLINDNNKEIIILYFGDYDPSGVDIPRSINDNLARLQTQNYLVEVIALHPDQIKRCALPPYPAKATDSRARNWEGGTVELDAMDPHELQNICSASIKEYFNEKLFSELIEQQEEEQIIYRKELFKFVKDMADKK